MVCKLVKLVEFPIHWQLKKRTHGRLIGAEAASTHGRANQQAQNKQRYYRTSSGPRGAKPAAIIGSSQGAVDSGLFNSSDSSVPIAAETAAETAVAGRDANWHPPQQSTCESSAYSLPHEDRDLQQVCPTIPADARLDGQTV
jgi:hypothetical protein